VKQRLIFAAVLLLGAALVGASQAQISAPSPVNVSQIAGSAPTVKAASTASVATDTSIVIAHSPNGGNPCANPSTALGQLSGTTSGTSLTQILALSGSTKVYVCSLSVIATAGTNPTFQLEYGTSSNCGSGTTALTQAIPIVTTSLFAFANPVGLTTAGQALCYVVGGTVSPVAKYQLTYVQQ